MQFLKPGILSTIQDTGRNAYRYSGINPNGAMDKTAARLLNILLGNHENEAVLECHFPAPEILFEEAAIIAIGGADFAPYLVNENGGISPINNWQAIQIPAGNTLKFRKRINGQRAYLAVKEGIQAQAWLGSKSTNSLLDFNTIRSRQRFALSSTNPSAFLPYLGLSIRPPYGASPVIRLIKGNEYNLLTNNSRALLQSQPFTISPQSNRMGYRLMGEALQLSEKTELVSSAVDFGTVQLLPDGQMIILMADHQTTGGYPRVGHVISVDLPLLAQCGPKDTIRFQYISAAEAEDLLILREKEIKKLKATIRFMNII
ncbi:5-oxoprolinase subunit C family protein [Emticicia fluvialis]|uniref:5-oxoprolinase subunit C family protein n=1 Tax=Emticicia fluvialis TaxID=2974474 RepID=UPI002164F104|nr:biotin-dependent carboxyltransferase family protein [Emticicia fluvialis]